MGRTAGGGKVEAFTLRRAKAKVLWLGDEVPVNCWHNTILSCTVDEYYRSRSVTEILIESVRKRKLTEDSQ